MDWFFYITIFAGSCVILYFSGELVLNNLMKFAKFLGLKEFVVAFFVMACAASLPNLFVGITSAMAKIPELSLGDIFGNNFTALTLAIAVAIFFSPNKEITIESRVIKSTSYFTFLIALLPLVLMSDGVLSRLDGGILISFFIFYTIWLFSKKERFSKIYSSEEEGEPPVLLLKNSLASAGKIMFGIFMIFIAAQGIVYSASFFATALGLPVIFIGLIIVGFGNALPEVYFSIVSARKGEIFMILGNLLGSVIIPASLVLGIVAIIHPITLSQEPMITASRLFLFLAATFFLIFSKTHSKITLREGWFLFILYLLFITTIIVLV